MQPRSLPVDLNNALQLYRQGQLVAARELCRKILESPTDDFRPHHLLASIEQKLGNTGAAVAALEKACRISGSDVAMWKQYGFLLHTQNEERRALDAYRHVVSLTPDDAAAWCEIGALLESCGNRDESVQAHRRAFSLAGTPKSALALSLADPEFGSLASERRPMNQALNGRLDPRSQEYLCFALCRIYERLGRYEKAFSIARRGQALRRRQGDFQVEARVRSARKLLPLFNEALLERCDQGGDSSEQPVFIVGMPRSGTTLVEQVITSHPEATGIGEFNGLALSVAPVIRAINGPAGAAETLRATDWQDPATAYLRQVRARAGGDVNRRIADKNPFNFTLLGFVRLMFPRARIIHCERNTLDTLWSCFSTSFAAPNLCYSQEELGRLYGLEQACMAYWKAHFSDAVHTVSHEHLVEDFPTRARQMIRFLGLDWHEDCASFHQTERIVRTASSAQVTQPLYNHHLNRGQPFAPWLNGALDALETTRAELEKDWGLA